MLVQVDDASLLRLRVGHHRPKLRDPKDLVARSHSRLQEENGTVGVQLDHQRDEREDRRQDAEPDRRCHDVHRPLEELGRSIEAWRAHAHKRNAFDRVNVDDGTDHVEEPRDDVDLDVLVVELADEPNRCLVVLTREREDHSLDVQKRDEIEQVAGIAEEREVLEARLALLGIGIDEADEVDAVLGMFQELPGDGLADVAGAHDDRVLQVGEVAPAIRPCGNTEHARTDDCKQPKDEKLGERRREPQRDPRERVQKERSHRQ